MKKWIALGVLAIAALLLVFLVILPNSRKANQYSQAMQLISEGRYAEASDLLAPLMDPVYEDAGVKWCEAQKALAEQKAAGGDWEGAIQVYAGITGYRKGKTVLTYPKEYANALTSYAQALADENRTDEALAVLDRNLTDPPEGFTYTDTLKKTKAQLLVQAGRYAEAEAVYEELMSTAIVRKPYEGPYMECLYLHGSQLEEEGKAEEAAALYQKALSYYTKDNEYEPMRGLILADARQLLDENRLAEAAHALALLHDEYKSYRELRSDIEALQHETVAAYVAAEDWEGLYNSDLRDEFSRTPELTDIYYLISTDRGALIGQNPDFNALVAAQPEENAVNIPTLYRDLIHAEGDHAEQFAAAVAYARSRGIELEFLRTGMDYASGKGVRNTVILPDWLKERLPAHEKPGSGGYLYEEKFVSQYGELADFRATEPRPGYYVLIKARDSQAFPGTEVQNAGTLIAALAAKGEEEIPYVCVSNPHAASLLLVVDSQYVPARTYQLSQTVPNMPGMVLPGSGETYTAMVETFSYQLWDTVRGGLIGSGSLQASSEISGNYRVSAAQRDDTNKTFDLRISSDIVSRAEEGAEALYQASRSHVADFLASFRTDGQP